MARSVAAPQHQAHPSPRDLRAQAIHRLLFGLGGLAGMLLIVGLANIIMDRAQQNEADLSAPAQTAEKSEGSDPLADIGVAPAASPSGKDAAPKSGN